MGKVLNWQSKLKEKNPLLKENILLIYYTIFHISCISYGNRGMFRYILQGRFIAEYVFILNFYVKTSVSSPWNSSGMFILGKGQKGQKGSET